MRIGQAAFRRILLQEHGVGCAFTGAAPLEVLQAGHLYSYAASGVHHASGGLLLRRDVHRLFGGQTGHVTETWRSAPGVEAAEPALRNLLESVEQQHGLHYCARGANGEAGLGAAPDAYAAFYVGRYGMSIALDPDDAAHLSARCGLKRLQKNPTTHYVKVPNERLAEDKVINLVRAGLNQALQRSWHGPRGHRAGGGDQLGKPQPTCPVHNYELAVNGWCSGCDDVAPPM